MFAWWQSLTKLDVVVTGLAVVLTIGLLGQRIHEHLFYESAADQVASNIVRVAAVVKQFHENSGDWFPREVGEKEFRVYLNPFEKSSPGYQGLNQEWLWRENNFGMVLQLVRFSRQRDSGDLTSYLFEQPFVRGEPYLRILLDQGLDGQKELEILNRLQKRLPSGSLALVDDAYFAVDLRRIISEQ